MLHSFIDSLSYIDKEGAASNSKAEVGGRDNENAGGTSARRQEHRRKELSTPTPLPLLYHSAIKRHDDDDDDDDDRRMCNRRRTSSLLEIATAMTFADVLSCGLCNIISTIVWSAILLLLTCRLEATSTLDREAMKRLQERFFVTATKKRLPRSPW